MSGPVDYEAPGSGVAVITLNRPERLNAISRGLIDGLVQALTAARSDPLVRVVVLRGEGRAFCAGDDLDELVKDPLSPMELRDWTGRLQDITRLMMFSDLHVIALVKGWAIGGGAAWPLNADTAVWSEDAGFFLPEARYGLFVSGAMSLLLPERCGAERAQSLMLTGERLDCAGLLRDRIATRACAAAKLDSVGLALADQLLVLPPRSLAAYKQARIAPLRSAIEQALIFEQEANIAGLTDQGLFDRVSPGRRDAAPAPKATGEHP